VAGIKRLTRGGVYLARLDPAKGAELGKLRPVIVLTDQAILDATPGHVFVCHVFVCPLSSRSDPAYQALHLSLAARDNLQVQSYALVEHCRAISIRRLQSERLAQLEFDELNEIIRRLHRLIGW
jgi:mRNA interferase MazF